MPEFTDKQKTAIGITDRSLLLSAAAGSGKTTTLIERILRSVTREDAPVMLDRLLVVTFTEAAAGELRVRIAKALSGAVAENGADGLLAKQLTLLPGAQISTIDAFYLRLVRANFAACGISPTFRIADEGEAALMLTEAADEVLQSAYDDPDSRVCGGSEKFARLVGKLVGAKNDDRLQDCLLSLYRDLSCQPRGIQTLLDCAEQLTEDAKAEFLETPHGMRLADEARDKLEYFKASYAYAISLLERNAKASEKWLPAFTEEYTGILRALSELDNSCEAFRACMETLAPAKLLPLRDDDFPEKAKCKRLRDAYCTFLKEDRFSGWFGPSDERLQAQLTEAADVCRGLYSLLCAMEERLDAEKKRRGAFGFDDITRMAYRLLVDENGEDTPLAKEYKERFDAVYVDEYQDVNAVQDRIFHAVAKEDDLFVVGDVKQSIYGFRGASAQVFADLRRSYPEYRAGDGEKCARLFMNENFRCDECVIECTNRLFDTLMPLLSPALGYTSEDALVFAKREKTPPPPHPVRVLAFEGEPSAEASWIAGEIARLCAGETKNDGKPFSFGDFAILLPTLKGRTEVYERALAARGIPVRTESGASLLAQSEIRILHSLLKVLDNPRRDIALCAVLLSPLCGITPDTLAFLRAENGGERLYTSIRKGLDASRIPSADAEKLTRFFDALSELRAEARFLAVGDLLDAVYALWSVPARLGGTSGLRRANLERFRMEAHRFSGGEGGSLSAFLRRLAAEEETSGGPEAAKPQHTSGGAVTLTSIHRSKGLEYPAVFVADASHGYNLLDAYGTLLYDPEAGVGMKLRDATGFGIDTNPVYLSVGLAVKQRLKEEKLRLLYVALTRARERLYLCGTVPSYKSRPAAEKFADMREESAFLTRYGARAKTDFLSLVLLALGEEELPFCKVEFVPYAEETAPEVVRESRELPLPDAAEVAALQKKFAYQYPHTARTKLPAKLSVSRLYPDVLDDEVLSDRVDAEKLPALLAGPRFALGEDAGAAAAARGTATHLYMQFFDFENAAINGAAAELARLREQRFLTEADAALVALPEVETFLRSPLFARMRRAKAVYREQRFNLALPAAEFAEDAELKTELSGETLLVQGVIDCFFVEENGDGILIDYKTDRLPKDPEAARAILRERHTRQLSYYKQAVERLCGKPPRETYLYSLCLGEAVEIL